MGKGKGSQAKTQARNQAAEAARRQEAQAVKADPYWIRHLNRNSQITSAVFAYTNSEGHLTDNGHEKWTAEQLRQFANAENEELLNRPAYGISEHCGTIRHTLHEVGQHLSKPTCLFNKALFEKRLANMFAAVEALEVLDTGSSADHSERTFFHPDAKHIFHSVLRFSVQNRVHAQLSKQYVLEYFHLSVGACTTPSAPSWWQQKPGRPVDRNEHSFKA